MKDEFPRDEFPREGMNKVAGEIWMMEGWEKSFEFHVEYLFEDLMGRDVETVDGWTP